ncbi:hypothetical protein AB1Y20_016770 [Prymnesium parvum]|uniref:Meckelin n=1 Tax=Prymnesium parvum TaxID=97485 RepID=A0AB34IC93_PRYPA
MRARTSAAHVLLLCAAAVLSYDAIPYPECGSGEYFDISSLLCESCPAGQEPDALGTSCQCSSGVLQGSACVPCPAGAAPSRDGTACVACLPPANSSCAEEAAQGVCNGTASGCAFAGECACPLGLAVVEDDGVGGLLPFKRCRACAAGKYFSGVDAYTCTACPAANMVARADAQGCQCAAGYLSRQHLNGWWGREISCVPLAEYTAAGFAEFDTTAATRVRFRDVVGGGTFEVSSSKIFQQLLLPAAVDCYRAVSASPLLPRAQPLLAGNEACQAVGNLCVLQLYDETTEACRLYRALQDFSTTVPSHQENEWRLRMPGLYYAEGPAAYTIENINYLEVALPPSAGSELQYMLAAYSLNGTYLGLSVLDAQLQLCSGISRHPSAFRSVGTSQRLACDLTLSQLLEYAEPVFFDLYLYHDPELSPSTFFPSTGGASDAAKSLYPVPVKLLNYQRNGVRPNADGDSTTARLNDQLTRRFFLVDSAAGATDGAAATLPSAVRWASLVELLFTLRTTVHPSRVLPPVLTVEYSEAVLPATATAASLDQTYAQLGGATPTASFVATYTMQMDGTTSTLSILLVMLIVAWILGWFVSLLFVMRRNQRQVVDGVFMLKALALLCAVFASAFFWLVFGASAWLFLLFKAQESIYLMMPSEDYWNFELLLSLTFIAKCVHVVDLLHTQTQHDIFFIDFEQPALPPGGAAHDGLEKATTVSAWRTVFVANEWVKLQGQRKISIELSLLLLLFVLRGLEWERYATRSKPPLQTHTHMRISTRCNTYHTTTTPTPRLHRHLHHHHHTDATPTPPSTPPPPHRRHAYTAIYTTTTTPTPRLHRHLHHHTTTTTPTPRLHRHLHHDKPPRHHEQHHYPLHLHSTSTPPPLHLHSTSTPPPLHLHLHSTSTPPPPPLHLHSTSTPPPLHHHSTSTTPPLHLHCTTTPPPLHLHSTSTPPPLHLHSTSTPPPLHLHSTSTPPPLHLHSTSTPPPLHLHYTSTTPPLHLHFTSTSPPLHLHYTSTTPPLHLHFISTAPPLHLHLTSTSPPPHLHLTSTSPPPHLHYTSTSPPLHLHFTSTPLHLHYTSTTPPLHLHYTSTTPPLHLHYTTTTPPLHLHYTSTTPPLHLHYTTTTPPLHHHYTSTTPPLHLHYTSTTPPLHLHYTSTTPPLHLHYTSTTPPLHLHYTSTTPSLHLHYTSTTPPLHLHYTSTTPPLHLHYTSTTPPLHLHYTSTTPPLHLHYTSTTPSLHLHYTSTTPPLHLHYTSTTPPLHHHYTSTTPPLHHHYTTTTPPLHHHYTSTTPPLHLLYTSTTPPLHLHYTSTTPPLHLHYTSTTPPLHLHYTSTTPPLHHHYTTTTPLHLHYTSTTPPLHLHYTSTTPPLHLHYTTTTPSLHLHYTSTTPPLHLHYTTTPPLHHLHTSTTHVCYASAHPPAPFSPQGLGEAGVPEHFLLRFALSSALLIGIAMAQAFFRWAVWDRFIKDRIWQFVDLLSVTNVSCILLEERYFGYYLHGKTVHQHADADLLTLNKNLQDEEDGKLPKRGYTQNSDIQTFEIHITRGVREQYDEAFIGETGRPLDIRQRGSLRQRRGFRSTPEELLRKRQKVNQFFTEFLIRPLQEKQAGASQVEQVVVRQKTYWEKLLHIPPETSFSTHRSFFLEDPGGRFRRIMLAGREYDLVMFNVLTYGLFDMVYTNTFVAIFFTYFLDLLVRVVRAELAVYNIARKTCIDQRFLL